MKALSSLGDLDGDVFVWPSQGESRSQKIRDRCDPVGPGVLPVGSESVILVSRE